MFSYFTAVYGLKQNEKFQESLVINDLLRRRNCIIYRHAVRHDTEKGESCGYQGVHFHALFEYITSIGYDDSIFKQIKMCCNYFTTQDLNPFDFFLLVNKYNMHFSFRTICDPTYLHKHREKYELLQRENTSPIAIAMPFHFNLPKTTPDSILDLCKLFSLNSSSENYLTPSDSTAFVQNWCIAQNIDPGEFVNNWIYCLNMEHQFKNTLYFQGANNSFPKAILNSVIDACQLFVGEVSNGTTGYKFFWKCCVGKRMIALHEPHFDPLHSTDKMLEVLEGTQSIVPVDENTYVSLQRTPVIIIGKEFPEDRKLQFEIQNRLVKLYSGLKSFQPPSKKLHPMWLYQMAEVHYVPWRDKDNLKRRPEALYISTINRSTVQLRTPAGVNIVENVTVQPETSPVANILGNTTVQPGTSPVANILGNTTVQPGTSAVANVFGNTAVQSGILTEAQNPDILEEYFRISNSALESQKERDNVSDWNCSELSEYNSESDFMDSTEENTEKSLVNLELNRPELAVTLSNEAKKYVQNVRDIRKLENEGQQSSIPVIQPLHFSNTNKKKRKSEGGRQDQCKEKKRKKAFPNLSSFIKRVPHHCNDPPDTSNTKIGKGKLTKGVPYKNRKSLPPVSGLFGKATPQVSIGFGTPLDFQSEGINSPCNSSILVNSKKGNKGKIMENKIASESTHQASTSVRAHQVQQKKASSSITPGLGTQDPGPSTKNGNQEGRKPSNTDRLSAKDKIVKEWQRSPQPPKHMPKCTYKNLRRNQD